jgi:glyoxylate reductase
MAHIFVTRQLPGPALERLASLHDTTVWPSQLPPSYEELCARAEDADGLITMLSDRIDGGLIAGAPRLRSVSNYAVGYDNIDVPAASARGIVIGHTPDVLTEATADLAWALLMAAARQITHASADARAGKWKTWEPSRYLGADVHGATLGIIGAGRIGRAVARRGSGFGMEVLISARPGTTPEPGSDRTPLDEVLARSDFLSLHCPLTPETKNLINAQTLALMKPTAILINTARGPIVDQDALIEALRTGRIAAAGLDVTTPEPLPPEHPLWQTPNVTIVPHIGSATRSTRERMAVIAVDNLLAGLAGEPLPHQIPEQRANAPEQRENTPEQQPN